MHVAPTIKKAATSNTKMALPPRDRPALRSIDVRAGGELFAPRPKPSVVMASFVIRRLQCPVRLNRARGLRSPAPRFRPLRGLLALLPHDFGRTSPCGFFHENLTQSCISAPPDRKSAKARLRGECDTDVSRME